MTAALPITRFYRAFLIACHSSVRTSVRLSFRIFFFFFFYIFFVFSRTTWLISTNLSTKHPWEVGIQVYSNQGSRPFPRGDNNEISRIYWQNLKIFFSRTTGSISTILSGWNKWKIPPCSKGRWLRKSELHWWIFQIFLIGCWGLKFVQMKGHALF